MSHVMRKPVLPYANNKCADKPERSCSLISAFALRWLDSMIQVDLLNSNFQDSS